MVWLTEGIKHITLFVKKNLCFNALTAFICLITSGKIDFFVIKLLKINLK